MLPLSTNAYNHTPMHWHQKYNSWARDKIKTIVENHAHSLQQKENPQRLAVVKQLRTLLTETKCCLENSCCLLGDDELPTLPQRILQWKTLNSFAKQITKSRHRVTLWNKGKNDDPNKLNCGLIRSPITEMDYCGLDQIQTSQQQENELNNRFIISAADLWGEKKVSWESWEQYNEAE